MNLEIGKSLTFRKIKTLIWLEKSLSEVYYY